MLDPALVCRLLERAPRFESIAHAVWWLRWRAGQDVRTTTHCVESLIGYERHTEHIEIHLAYIYALAEVLYHDQNCEGV